MASLDISGVDVLNGQLELLQLMNSAMPDDADDEANPGKSGAGGQAENDDLLGGGKDDCLTAIVAAFLFDGCSKTRVLVQSDNKGLWGRRLEQRGPRKLPRPVHMTLSHLQCLALVCPHSYAPLRRSLIIAVVTSSRGSCRCPPVSWPTVPATMYGCPIRDIIGAIDESLVRVNTLHRPKKHRILGSGSTGGPL